MPNALPRSFGSVNVVASSDSAAGARMAPNTPWQARAVTSIPKFTDAPPTADATAKPARPVINMTLRPIKSASRPENSSRLPNDSEYAVTIHCRSTLLKCSARCADGSAMFMTVASSTTISCAVAITTRISQRRGSGWAAVAPQPGCVPPFSPAGTGTLASDIPITNLEGTVPLKGREYHETEEPPPLGVLYTA